MKREFNRKGGAGSARRVTVRAKNLTGKRDAQVCDPDAVQLTRFAKKPIRTGSESMKSVLLVDDEDEPALSPGDNWLPRTIGQ
jgi:hypothetical protein